MLSPESTTTATMLASCFLLVILKEAAVGANMPATAFRASVDLKHPVTSSRSFSSRHEAMSIEPAISSSGSYFDTDSEDSEAYMEVDDHHQQQRRSHEVSSLFEKYQQAEAHRRKGDEMRTHVNDMLDRYTNAVQEVLKGTIAAPANVFGETLDMERENSGAICAPTSNNVSVKRQQQQQQQQQFQHTNQVRPTGFEADRKVATSDTDTSTDQINDLVGGASNKLLGGAQYHRAVREMYIMAHVSPLIMKVTEEEIALMSGVSDVHDGPDYLRVVSKLALHKTFEGFDSLLDVFEKRCQHIMQNMYPAVEHLVKNDAYSSNGGSFFSFDDPDKLPSAIDSSDEEMVKEVIKRAYAEFVEMKAKETAEKCRDDLVALTRFLSWDIVNGVQMNSKAKLKTTGTNSALRSAEQEYAKLIARGGGGGSADDDVHNAKEIDDEGDLVGGVLSRGDGALHGGIVKLHVRSTAELIQHMLDVAYRSPGASGIGGKSNEVLSSVIASLVQNLTWGWRNDFAKAVATKFNTFFLLSFHEELFAFLRSQLEAVYR